MATEAGRRTGGEGRLRQRGARGAPARRRRARSRRTTRSSPRARSSMGGAVLLNTRALVDEALKNRSLFSSEDLVEQGNTLPLIPLNIDPPEHVKYRRLLDPLFAPRRIDALEADISERVNHFIDAFVDRGSCNFTAEFAELFPSSVFLGMMGLPVGRARHADRAARRAPPSRARGRCSPPSARRSSARRRQRVYAYFDAILDERAAAPRDDILSLFVTTESDGDAAHARRGRSRSASCCSPPGSTRSPTRSRASSPSSRSTPTTAVASSTTPTSSRTRSRSSCAGRRPCRQSSAGRARTSTLGGETVDGRSPRPGQPQRRQPRPGRVPRSARRAVRPAREPAPRVRRAACTAASARTWRAASCASRCGSGTGASRSTGSAPATRSRYLPPLRFVPDLQLSWPA